MDKKIIIYLTIAFAFVLVLGIGFAAVYASNVQKIQNNDGNQESPDKSVDTNSPEYKAFQKFNSEVENAIKNNDYATWKSLLESQLTQENFNKVVEQYKKMQSQNQTNSQ